MEGKGVRLASLLGGSLENRQADATPYISLYKPMFFAHDNSCGGVLGRIHTVLLR